MDKNDLDYERFTYGTPDVHKVKHMVILMRMLAPEWEFQPQTDNMFPSGWWGIYCKRLPCPCYVKIDYLRMEVDPIFIMGLNNCRKRSTAYNEGDNLWPIPMP